MKNAAIILKYSVFLIIALACLWFARSCNGTGGSNTSDTLSVKIDTVWMPSHDSLIYQPVPYKVTYIKTVVEHDTLETFDGSTRILINDNEFPISFTVDSLRILRQYLATRFYDTTFNIQYGNERIKDTVTQNRIIGRSISINQNVPIVKETVTLRQPKRTIFYIGAETFGNASSLPYATGIDLGFKLKNDMFIEIGGLLTKSDPMYKIGFKFPIKLRK